MRIKQDRREFTVAAALALLGGATITVAACSGGSTSSPTGSSPSAAPSDKVGAVATNHGHAAVIRAAQLGAGGAVSLDIRGDAAHTHALTLSGGEVTQIAGGTRISKESTHGDNHTHTVTFN